MKVPLGLALPSMIYRLWTTRGSTEKLAQVSASVDSKYIASTEEALKKALRRRLRAQSIYSSL